MREEQFRKYKFSDAKLIVLTNEKIGYAERDEAEFSDYGFSPPDRAALQILCNTFQTNADDTEFEADKMEATELKTIAKQSLLIYTRQIMRRVVNKYGEKSARYRKFGTRGLSNQTDAELLTTGYRVERNARALLPSLISEGLTVGIVDNYLVAVSKYRDKLEKLTDKIGDRDIATEDRVIAGNALYFRLMEMCATGKTIWEDTSEARYNDYVIYNTTSGQNPDEEEEEDDSTPEE